MRRRALLTGLAGGVTVLAGCTTSAEDAPREVYNPTGRSTVRPLDEPLIQHGLTSESDQYFYARSFQPGDALPVTDDSDAEWLSETVDDLSGDQFAVFTNLRTAARAPAYFWPANTEWTDGRLHVELERQTISAEIETAEAVGVALTTFDCDGDPPDDAAVVFPGGATLSL